MQLHSFIQILCLICFQYNIENVFLRITICSLLLFQKSKQNIISIGFSHPYPNIVTSSRFLQFCLNESQDRGRNIVFCWRRLCLAGPQGLSFHYFAFLNTVTFINIFINNYKLFYGITVVNRIIIGIFLLQMQVYAKCSWLWKLVEKLRKILTWILASNWLVSLHLLRGLLSVYHHFHHFIWTRLYNDWSCKLRINHRLGGRRIYWPSFVCDIVALKEENFFEELNNSQHFDTNGAENETNFLS